LLLFDAKRKPPLADAIPHFFPIKIPGILHLLTTVALTAAVTFPVRHTVSLFRNCVASHWRQCFALQVLAGLLILLAKPNAAFRLRESARFSEIAVDAESLVDPGVVGSLREP